MKTLIKVQRLIEKNLTSAECWKLKKYCEEQAMQKTTLEHEQLIKNIGLGNRVLVRGGNSEAVRLNLACEIGEITKYNQKTVSVNLTSVKRPGVWRFPYGWLTTIDRLEEERKSREHTIEFQPYMNKFNKIVKEAL